MTVNEVKSHIKSGNFDKLYIFDVEDSHIAKIYIDKIAKKSGCRLEYTDKVSDIYSSLSKKSLFSNPKVYVVLNDKEFTNSKYESRWSKIESIIKDDILILEFTDVDRRIKFWKKFKDRAIKFSHLENRLLKRHIKSECNMSDKECDLLIDVCESDYGRIILELDKIKNSKLPLVELVDTGAIYSPPKDAIFDFSDAVLDNNPKLAYDLLQDCIEIGEPNMRLITVLYNNFRAVLQIQTCNGSSLSKSTGLTGWQIKNAKPYVDVYSDEKLVSILGTLEWAQKAIKTGMIADEVSLQWCLLNIFD